MTKKVKIGGSIAGVIIVLALGLFIFNQIEIAKEHHAEVVAQQKKEAAEKAAAKLKKEKAKKFDSAYSDFSADASATGVITEKIGGKIYDTWRKSIFNDSVSVNGKSYTDFNDAIQAQYDSLSKDGSLDKASSLMDETETDYNTLKKNVTDKDQDRFQKASDFYSALKKFYSTSTNPTGSFDTFSTEYNKEDSNLTNMIDNLDF